MNSRQLSENAVGIYTISLVGNPNVGKTSVFNALTGMHQHTGNWPGKTVEMAQGYYDYKGKRYRLIDLPGTYSLTAYSEEEKITRDFIFSKETACTIVVGDATCLERNIYLLLQILQMGQPVVFCVNLMDEAERNGIEIDLDLLQRRLGIPVIGTSASNGQGMGRLRETIRNMRDGFISIASAKEDERRDAKEIAEQAAELYHAACKRPNDHGLHWIDQIVMKKAAGYTLMLALLMGIFWLTVQGANYPSAMLQSGFDRVKLYLYEWTARWPGPLRGMLIDGVYETVGKVVSVMLPPMSIFFPLFTLMEDIGYLPRVAFLMDHTFERCGSCGKQSLTMAMGLGCNAAGVVGCRIIASRRERLIAVLTNSLMPCNGRFPTLIVLISFFFSNNSFLGAVILMLLLLLCVGVTFLASRVLSQTLLKGAESNFILEIPPYRKPKICRILIRSLLNRIVYVLGRAIAVAAPAGALIWILQAVQISGHSLLTHMAVRLDPVGQFFGMNGIILSAFLLSFPANELFLPLVVMITNGAMSSFGMAAGTLDSVFQKQPWNWELALITMIFVLFHWPCSTTCLTIRKETQSWFWTAVSVFLPTILGLGLCWILSNII